MNSEGAAHRGNRRRSPLRRAHSLESVLPGEEPNWQLGIAGVLQDISLGARRALRDLDWSGDRIPRTRQLDMSNGLRDIGVNLRRHYSFGSDDMDSLTDGALTPRTLRRTVDAEIERMRRNVDLSANEHPEVAVGGVPEENMSPVRPMRRSQLLQVELQDLRDRHNRMLNEFSRMIDLNQELQRVIYERNEEIGAARAAEQRAEDAATAGTAGRLEQVQLRDRRRTNFGEDNWNVDLAFKIIREFDGTDSDKLEGFLKNCRMVFGRVHWRDHDALLELITTTKLTGRAMRDMRHKEVNSMDELAVELEALYGKTKSLSALQMDLSSLRQKEGEGVSSYGVRAERITSELVEELSKAETTQAGKRAVEETIRRLGKASFENGLQGQLQVLVRSRDFGTLHESVNGAIDMARTINMRPGRSQQLEGKETSKNCYKCGEPGHIARDCTQQPAGKGTKLPMPSNHRGIHAFGVLCKYCGLTGHETLACNKLKKKLDIPESTNLQVSQKTKGSNEEDFKLPVGSFQIM